jgi:Rieske Fe-S protein
MVMSSPSTWRQEHSQKARGLWTLLVAVLMALCLLVSGATFLWPRNADAQPWVSAGSIDRLEIDEPTLFYGAGAPYVYLVRTSMDEVVALISKDTNRGCIVSWHPTLLFNGTQGWFRDPCHDSTYDLMGNCVFGPCPRGLDRYEVQMHGKQMQVYVGETRIIKGKPGRLSNPFLR